MATWADVWEMMGILSYHVGRDLQVDMEIAAGRVIGPMTTAEFVARFGDPDA